MLGKTITFRGLVICSLSVTVLCCTSCQTTPASKTTSKLSVNKAKRTASKEKKQKAKKEAETARLPSTEAMQIPIGTVHMVDQDGKFVLIKSSRTTNVDPETQIIAYGPNAQMSSHLKASPARKGAFLTADLVDGVPAVGDMVMMVRTIHKPTPTQSQKGETADPLGTIQVLE